MTRRIAALTPIALLLLADTAWGAKYWGVILTPFL